MRPHDPYQCDLHIAAQITPVPILKHLKASIPQSQKMSEGTLKLSFWPLEGINSPNLAESLCSGKKDDYTRTPSHQATPIAALEHDTTRLRWSKGKPVGYAGSGYQIYDGTASYPSEEPSSSTNTQIPPSENWVTLFPKKGVQPALGPHYKKMSDLKPQDPSTLAKDPVNAPS
ncbi:hypothetical protein Cgig2_020752 [Carnegiea gigantea]|uniref:Uncharacterized protein n=1 Tax=Carnegiea gigantea TaxID=171969 RepID=A0A9Q1JEE5_9CARY|nr:hypothetical protein Cgig2_020752 [Carnegiea gigantea]